MIIELHDENTIKVDIFNGRNLLVSVKSKLVKLVKDGETITGLYFSDGFNIEKGDLFPLISNCDTKTMYHVKHINITTDDTYLISCDIINKTTHWLLPFIAKNEEEIGYDTVLENAYAFKTNKIFDMYNEGYLFLKYKYLKEHDFFLNSLKQHKNCTFVNQHYSRYEYLYVFKIPEQWKEDVDLIIQGRYSEISDKAKKRILQFHDLSVDGKTGKILYKSEEYMKELQEEFDVDFPLDELEERFNKQLETLI